jgi:hypothetical protein
MRFLINNFLESYKNEYEYEYKKAVQRVRFFCVDISTIGGHDITFPPKDTPVPLSVNM